MPSVTLLLILYIRLNFSSNNKNTSSTTGVDKLNEGIDFSSQPKEYVSMWIAVFLNSSITYNLVNDTVTELKTTLAVTALIQLTLN